MLSANRVDFGLFVSKISFDSPPSRFNTTFKLKSSGYPQNLGALKTGSLPRKSSLGPTGKTTTCSTSSPRNLPPPGVIVAANKMQSDPVGLASLWFEKRLNFSINPCKLSIFSRFFWNRSEAQGRMLLV